MREIIKAPFTKKQVERLNNFQKNGKFHPFNCGGNKNDKKNLDEGLLIATESGWICPYCDYKQDWAHKFMAEPINLNWPSNQKK